MKEDVFNQYVSAIINRLGITRIELFTKNKEREIAEARFMLYYLCRNRGLKIALICKYLEKNNYSVGHSVVQHGIKRFEQMIENDPDYNEALKKVIEIGG